MALKLRTSATATIVDFSLVESGIRRKAVDGVHRGLAFARYVTEAIFGVAATEIDDHVVDGGNDRGIDIIFIDHNTETINLSSCKCVAKFEKSARNFPGAEVDKLIAFVDDLFLKNENILNEANGFICSKIRDIWEIFDNGENYKINLHLFSNQLTLTPLDRERLLDRVARYKVNVFEHGLYELSHGVIRASKTNFRKKLSPEKNSAFEVLENGHRGWQTRVSLTNVLSFLTNPETEAFDERLVSHNVRYFLGVDNPVNKEIRDTLISGRAHDFWWLNNGITVVSDQIVCAGTGNHSMTLVNPKIVNGGQTANVIYEVGKNPLLKGGNGSITVKLIETKDEEFIQRIALASNTQSRIFGRDLRAFDSFQEKLARTILEEGFFYRRKRGEPSPVRSFPVIDMARAGQLLLAYAAGEPTKSKTASNDIFDDLYEEAFDDSKVSALIVIAAHLCHGSIEQRRRVAIAHQRSMSRNSFSETWLIEGHFHVLFVVGELMKRRRIPLTEHANAFALVDEAISIVEKFVANNPGVSAYRLFRLTSSTTAIRRSLDETWTASRGGPVQLSLDLK
jgi:hypothetical protein